MKYGSAEFWMSSLVEYARWKVSVTEICERNLGKVPNSWHYLTPKHLFALPTLPAKYVSSKDIHILIMQKYLEKTPKKRGMTKQNANCHS